MPLLNKYLAIDWGSYSFFSDPLRPYRQRRWRFRHNRRPKNFYAQFGPLEITVWYR